MNHRDKRTTALAITVLRLALKDYSGNIRNVPVRLALRVLLPWVGQQELLTFWTVAANINPAQRTMILRKVLKQIEMDLMRARIDH